MPTLKERKICFRLNTHRIAMAVLMATSAVNLIIVRAVSESPASSVPATLTPVLTALSSPSPSLVTTSIEVHISTFTLTPTYVPTETPSATPTYTFTPTSTVTQTPSVTPTYTFTSTNTPTLSPSPFPCMPQNTWPLYSVQRGDTLSYLARATNSTVDGLIQANCLPNDTIYAGQWLYVPQLPIATPTATPTTVSRACAEFEDLKPGTAYRVGEIFLTSGLSITVEPFVWGMGVPTSGGLVYVTTGQAAGGFGTEIQTNNANIVFDFSAFPSSLSLLFGEYGSDLNININGDFRTIRDFADIHGLKLGGVKISVLKGFGNDAGYLQLSGAIRTFAVGGQELWIDNVCLTT